MDRLPLTLVSGLSAALREQFVSRALVERPEAVAVGYAAPSGAGGPALVREVRDARGVHDRAEVELVGCCLACTVRADVEGALALVAGAERWSQVLLVLPTPVTAGPVARALRGSADVVVDTVTTVVDAVLLAEHVSGGDLLADRALEAAPTDGRSTAELVLGQLEDADVVALAGLDRLDEERSAFTAALVAHLAPLALPVRLGPAAEGAGTAVGTGRHDSAGTPATREQLAALAAGLCTPACGVATVAWSAEGALDPVRLLDGLEQVLEGVVRSRGWVALADRPGRRVRWESAGTALWFDDPVPDEGPARCALVLVGLDLDEEVLREALGACLAAPAEVE